MKTKKVNRYYCDFCKKSGCAAGHMHKHERRCTLNPERECGVCGILELTDQPPVSELMALLPDPEPYRTDDECGESFSYALANAANEALPELRKAANNCPACTMAAIRQRSIPLAMVEDFDFKREMESAWSELNNEREEVY